MQLSIISTIKAEQKAWLILGISVLVLVLTMQFGAVPQIALGRRASHAAATAIAQSTLLRDPQYAVQIKQQNDSLRTIIATLGSQPKDLSSVLQLLIGNASRSDIAFVKMEPQAEAVVAGSRGYPVFLQIKTTYHNLGKFINACEAMPQNMRISRLAITAAANDAIDVRVLVTCFYRPDLRGTP